MGVQGLSSRLPDGMPVISVELSAPTNSIMGSGLWGLEDIHCGGAKFRLSSYRSSERWSPFVHCNL